MMQVLTHNEGKKRGDPFEPPPILVKTKILT